MADGNYLLESPSTLFQQGRFDHSLSIMAGHTQDEGSLFSLITLVIDDQSYTAFFKSLVKPSNSSPTTLHQLIQELYPPVFDGSQDYDTQTQRNNLTIANATVVCNTRFINQAPFISPTYAYVFSVPPAPHWSDLPYTFYDFDDYDVPCGIKYHRGRDPAGVYHTFYRDGPT